MTDNRELDYRQLYDLERRRADMCEGVILELRRRVAALEQEVRDLKSDRDFWKRRLHEEISKLNDLKRERRELRKLLAAPQEPTP